MELTYWLILLCSLINPASTKQSWFLKNYTKDLDRHKQSEESHEAGNTDFPFSQGGESKYIGNIREATEQARLNRINREGDSEADGHIIMYGKPKSYTDDKTVYRTKRENNFNVSVSRGITADDKVRNCRLVVSSRSAVEFNSRVLHYKADVITLNLKFSKHVTVTETQGVISPLTWRWVYTETSSYLRMPYPAAIWSLGLLYLHNGGPLNIELDFPDNVHVPRYCLNITIGDVSSDQIIGNALGKMTEFVAAKYFRYNSSHWCYVRKIEENENRLVSNIYKSFVRLTPDLENMCCLYNTQVNPDSVVCMRPHNFDPVWWDVPIGLGVFMLLYFPLVFLKLCGIVHEQMKKSSISANTDIKNMRNSQEDTSIVTVEKVTKDISSVYLKQNPPITAASIITSVVSPLLPAKLSTKSRVAIFIWTISTLVIPGIEVLFYHIYLHDHVVDLARNNVTTSWTTLMLGWEGSHKKLHIFGGQYVALGLYFVFGWAILLSPKILADEIYNGVTDNGKDSTFTLSLERKESLGSVSITKCNNGYIRLYKLQVCHVYMLVNMDFWKLIIQTVTERWCSFMSFLNRLVGNKIFRYIVAMLFIPFYIVLSIIEIVLTITFYLIPLFSFIFYLLKSFACGLDKYLVAKLFVNYHRIGIVFRFFAFTVMIACFAFHLYIFVLLFIHSFIFLARVLMFTFTALVAYPSETYGYFMLFLLSAYFVLEGFFHFGDVYKLILKESISFCKKDDTLSKKLHTYLDSNGDEVIGISRYVFEYLVERIRPRRVQVLHTIIKLTSIIFVLSVSIILLERFKRFEQLSLLAHIFITVFICALPALCNVLLAKNDWKTRVKRRVKRKLRKLAFKNEH